MKRIMTGLVILVLTIVPLQDCMGAQRGQTAPQRSLKGAWQGTLKVPGTALRIVFNFVEKPGGVFAATLDSPDQGAKGIPADTVVLNDSLVQIPVRVIGGLFEGKLIAGADSIVGSWKQGGVVLPLTVRYVGAEAEAPKRPQEPKKPYPYKEEEVSYPNERAGIILAGTLTLPEGKGPYPAVILITGSGPQDRDETIFGHRPFLVLSDYLTRRGIAVLRSDDRGMGKSTGDFKTATSVDFAGDVESALHYLESRQDIRHERIGLIGHSEGGMIAPMVAARSKDVAFIVMMAGTGVTGEELILKQAALISAAMGATEKEVKQQDETSRKVYAIVESGNDSATTHTRLKEIFTDAARRTDTSRTQQPQANDAVIEAQIRQVTSPWFRFFLTCDPRPILKKVSCPVLAINGEKDLQVPPEQNLPEIEAALREGGNGDFTVRELPGLNHLFQTSEHGRPDEYGKIEETISPSALSLMGDWIVKHCK